MNISSNTVKLLNEIGEFFEKIINDSTSAEEIFNLMRTIGANAFIFLFKFQEDAAIEFMNDLLNNRKELVKHMNIHPPIHTRDDNETLH